MLLQCSPSPNSGQLKICNPIISQYSSCLMSAGAGIGSSGKNLNCLQCCMFKCTSFESSPRLGSVTKLFPIKFNLSNHRIHPIASEIWLRPQKLISSSSKKEKLRKDDNRELVKHLCALGYKEWKGDVIHFNMEDTDCECNTISFESSFFKYLGLLNTLKHLERFRYTRELRPNMLLGMLLRFLQFSKFKNTSFLRRPIDGSICTSFTHPSRFSFSRFGTSPKFGILIRFLE